MSILIIEEDACKPNPCINGKCSSPEPGEFMCTCDEGYGGELCDKGENKMRH